MATLTAYLATRAAIEEAIEIDNRAPAYIRLGNGSYALIQRLEPGAKRGDCGNVARPCPFSKCRHHLYLSIGFERAGRRVNGKTPKSTLRTVYRQNPPPPSCTLDVADSGAQSVDETGKHLGLEPSQVHAIEASALKKLRAQGLALEDLMAGER